MNERILNLLEELIAETSVDRVQGLVNGREKQLADAKGSKNPYEIAKANYKLANTYINAGNWQKRQEKTEAKKHLEELKKKMNDLSPRESERKQKVETLKKIFQKGDSEGAQIEQGKAINLQDRKNKLEKIFNKKSATIGN